MKQERIQKQNTYGSVILLPLLLVGCGKKIVQDNGLETSRPGASIDPVFETSASIAYNSTRKDGVLEAPRDGLISFPDTITVTAGNAGNYKLKTLVNVDETEYEFYCLYQGANEGKQYNFVGCFDPDNRDMEIHPEHLNEFKPNLTQDKKVIVRILGADPAQETKVHAVFNVDWR